MCADCGGALPHRRLAVDTALALALTAAVLAVAALDLPVVTVRKFGASHASYLWTGIHALWTSGMPLLAVWVALCGVLVPMALLVALIALIVTERTGSGGRPGRWWRRAAHALQRWSMPEVQVLAVLVAFVKIGALVDVEPGSGLWFYAAMAVAALLAWRNLEVEERKS